MGSERAETVSSRGSGTVCLRCCWWCRNVLPIPIQCDPGGQTGGDRECDDGAEANAGTHDPSGMCELLFDGTSVDVRSDCNLWRFRASFEL
jgi:hypothetical protein